jgi:hypothetical protein
MTCLGIMAEALVEVRAEDGADSRSDQQSLVPGRLQLMRRCEADQEGL